MTARWIILVLMIGVQNMATASFIMTFPNRGNSNTIDKRQPLSDNTGVRVMTKIKSRMAQQTQSNRLEKRMQAVYKKKPIQSTGTCSLDFKDNFDHPMLVKKGQNKLMYPVIQGNSRMVIIPPDTVVTASCPGPNNMISATNADKYIEVTCTSGQLRRNEVNVDWNTLSCSTKLKPTLSCSPATDPTLNKMELCTLKWDIAPKVEVIQYTSVIDPNLKTTLYTSHTLYGQ
ncbi:uncharacterized protein LOC121867944 [Homarus americanus]|uniref:uncharacterized protein LOC121867944 n=1 Tax=Homarus americanus TaxID=6706 RepID=UPI001C468C65|nr:uncharacterized protein LOC121867944 [Homarus americanus]